MYAIGIAAAVALAAGGLAGPAVPVGHHATVTGGETASVTLLQHWHARHGNADGARGYRHHSWAVSDGSQGQGQGQGQGQQMRDGSCDGTGPCAQAGTCVGACDGTGRGAGVQDGTGQGYAPRDGTGYGARDGGGHGHGVRDGSCRNG